ncbi:hypothetical protein DFJ74DRAFT_336131 [Hyaloraphidium curvatum]|nr:hypothetical protein DFJ74DRAFT_462716 [Hyaloraphidium curvatum]KAI9010052.1 hypothetical protein DFJ74DRAFT_336131 [Hyaloraphidium curvatum]
MDRGRLPRLPPPRLAGAGRVDKGADRRGAVGCRPRAAALHGLLGPGVGAAADPVDRQQRQVRHGAAGRGHGELGGAGAGRHCRGALVQGLRFAVRGAGGVRAAHAGRRRAVGAAGPRRSGGQGAVFEAARARPQGRALSLPAADVRAGHGGAGRPHPLRRIRPSLVQCVAVDDLLLLVDAGGDIRRVHVAHAVGRHPLRGLHRSEPRISLCQRHRNPASELRFPGAHPQAPQPGHVAGPGLPRPALRPARDRGPGAAVGTAAGRRDVHPPLRIHDRRMAASHPLGGVQHPPPRRRHRRPRVDRRRRDRGGQLPPRRLLLPPGLLPPRARLGPGQLLREHLARRRRPRAAPPRAHPPPQAGPLPVSPARAARPGGDLDASPGCLARYMGFAVDRAVARNVASTLFAMAVGLWSVLRGSGVSVGLEMACGG